MSLEKRYLMNTFSRLPVAFVRGEGVYLYDLDGKRYLDMVAGIAVNILGYGVKELIDALQLQINELIHVSNLYYSIPQLLAAQKLVSNLFPGKVFFCNSGAEANEAAIKVARKWGKLNKTGAYKIVSFTGGFHGRTLGALAATGQNKYKLYFEPMPEGFILLPYNQVDALEATLSEQDVVAVIFETIQGESGVVPADPGFIEEVARIAKSHNVLVIIDEVQTGLGRTGYWYSYQRLGIEPDIVTVAKGLGGGIPCGACVVSEEVDCLEPGDHGSTLGGNLLACQAACTVLDYIESHGLISNAASQGLYLEQGLDSIAQRYKDFVAEQRGYGLMRALVLSQPIAKRFESECLSQGLIVNAIGDHIIRMVPPLVVQKEHIDSTVEVMDRVIRKLLATGQ